LADALAERKMAFVAGPRQVGKPHSRGACSGIPRSPISPGTSCTTGGASCDRTGIDTLARLYFLFELRPFAGRLARTLRREAKVYLFDFTEVDDAGARFENVVALHLLKLVDGKNAPALSSPPNCGMAP
jgi:hypothetical protein